MVLDNGKRLRILSGNANPALAEEIRHYLGPNAGRSIGRAV